MCTTRTIAYGSASPSFLLVTILVMAAGTCEMAPLRQSAVQTVSDCFDCPSHTVCYNGTECAPCRSCPAGYGVVPNTCTLDSDTTCSPCPTGRYSPRFSMNVCIACKPPALLHCNTGFYKLPCIATSDTRCGSCLETVPVTDRSGWCEHCVQCRSAEEQLLKPCNDTSGRLCRPVTTLPTAPATPTPILSGNSPVFTATPTSSKSHPNTTAAIASKSGFSDAAIGGLVGGIFSFFTVTTICIILSVKNWGQVKTCIVRCVPCSIEGRGQQPTDAGTNENSSEPVKNSRAAGDPPRRQVRRDGDSFVPAKPSDSNDDTSNSLRHEKLYKSQQFPATSMGQSSQSYSSKDDQSRQWGPPSADTMAHQPTDLIPEDSTESNRMQTDGMHSGAILECETVHTATAQQPADESVATDYTESKASSLRFVGAEVAQSFDRRHTPIVAPSSARSSISTYESQKSRSSDSVAGATKSSSAAAAAAAAGADSLYNDASRMPKEVDMPKRSSRSKPAGDNDKNASLPHHPVMSDKMADAGLLVNMPMMEGHDGTTIGGGDMHNRATYGRDSHAGTAISATTISGTTANNSSSTNISGTTANNSSSSNDSGDRDMRANVYLAQGSSSHAQPHSENTHAAQSSAAQPSSELMDHESEDVERKAKPYSARSQRFLETDL